MYRFKGFVSIDSLVNNSSNVTSAIGEISPYSLTFAKDVKQFPSTTLGLTVYGFSSKSSEIGKITTPASIKEKALAFAEWIYTRQTALTVSETIDEFKTALRLEFADSCSNIDVSVMTAGLNGKLYPESVTFKLTGYEEENQNTLWFSDASFKQNYDEYEIVIVPPVTNLEILFGNYSTAVEAINLRSFTDSMDAIQTAREGYPETILTAEEYSYNNPANSSVKTKTNWSIMIYGPAGNDADIIRDTLIDYITRNSDRTEAEWKVIFPDIFKSTEFLIFPRWHNYAIEDMVLQSGIYSPIINLKKELDYIKANLPTFPQTFVDSHLQAMSYPYKNIMLDIIGGFENRDNVFELTQLYPDIINVSSTSLDFNRMLINTKGLLNKLASMIYVAESMDIHTELSNGYRRLERNGITYISTRYLNVRYLVASKLTTPDYA